MKQKRSNQPGKRIEGELPSAPAVANEIPKWWDEASSVIDRIRAETNQSLSQIDATKSLITSSNIKKLYEENADTNSFNDYYKNRLENLEDALGIDGAAMGTGNEQEIENKILGGGSF